MSVYALRCISSLVLAAGILSVASARAQLTRVVPAGTEEFADLPLTQPITYGEGRIQQLYEGSELGRAVATILELSFRADALTLGYQAKTVYMDVGLGYSNKTVATISSTFSANATGARTTILQANVSLPAQAPARGKPGPWNVTIKPASPFLYIRNNGNLLLDIALSLPTTLRSLYGLDAARFGAPGRSSSFGTPGRFRGGDRHSVQGRNQNLVPGGALEFYAFGLRQAYPALAVLGFSNTSFGAAKLPLELSALGAPGEQLYVSPDLILPLQLQQRGSTYIGLASTPLPALRALDGFVLFGQALYVDAASNAAGLVTSNGVRFVVGRARSSATVVAVTSLSPTSTTGTIALGSSPVGLVTRFRGSFR